MESTPTPAPRRMRLAIVLAVLATAAVVAPLGAFIATRFFATRPAEPVEQYQCPMHPTIVMPHPANCPICGMKLVKLNAAKSNEPIKSAERKPLMYRSPMDPRQTSPVPTKDSMGMDYVPVYEDEVPTRSEVDGLAPVEINTSRQQLLGLRTALVDRGVVGGAFDTVGVVGVDETQVRRISVKVAGYVEHIFVDFVGKSVRKGQPLFSLYSPEVLAAENEFLVALKAGTATPLSASSRRKLELWDVPESELRRLEREGTASKTVTFVAPRDGIVTRKDIVEGSRLEVGAMPYEVVDLSTVWVMAEIYETELRFVETGVPASLKLTAFPGRTYEGKVLFVDPLLDKQTRTARARLAFPNPTGELRPGLFGDVTIARPAREVTRLPSDAVIRGGKHDVVFVALGSGRFEPREVQLGEVGIEFIEVTSGVTVGEAVVTRANFLIDSESRLRASLSRLAPDVPGTDSTVPPESHGASP